jgi:hypothetical protein
MLSFTSENRLRPPGVDFAWEDRMRAHEARILLVEAAFKVHKGFTAAIPVESQRQGDSAYSFLSTDTGSPYVDNRPVKNAGQAEWRDYRACWWDADHASMDFGPVLRVLVTG